MRCTRTTERELCDFVRFHLCDRNVVKLVPLARVQLLNVGEVVARERRAKAGARLQRCQRDKQERDDEHEAVITNNGKTIMKAKKVSKRTSRKVPCSRMRSPQTASYWPSVQALLSLYARNVR